VIALFFSFSLFSQTVIVSGEIVDDSGNYLPGVSILVEGTKKWGFNRF